MISPLKSSSTVSSPAAKKRFSASAVDDVVVGQHRRVQKIILHSLVIVKIAVAVLVAIGLIWFFIPKHTSKQAVSIEIQKGQGVRQIAQELSQKRVIGSKAKFLWYAYSHRKPLQAGLYRFEPGESIDSIYKKLASGDVYEEKITIPEGWRREQIAQLLDKKSLVSYEAFMTVSQGKEGQLFPDTYRVPKKTTAGEVVRLMVDDFNSQFKNETISKNQLIIASIVEREAKKDGDRPKIASVFLNRIAKGIKLEADPTVQYALDSDRLGLAMAEDITNFTFWQPLKAGEAKSTVSQYNTYRIPGVPPTPIANPGKKSILAVLHPEQTNYLYFVNTADGTTYYAETLDQHNENIKKYHIGE